MLTDEQQKRHYDEIISNRRPTKGIFSCGFDERFDPFLLDTRPQLIPEFVSLFETAFPQPAERLLDIGCGSGLYFPLLAEKASAIVGVDISSGMIEAARVLISKKALDNVEVQVSSAEKLSFPEGSFDCVLGFDVLHHIANPKTAMAEVRRVLRPGGRFVSIEPNVLNPIVWIAHFLPREERLAVWRNYPWFVRRLIRKHIGKPRSSYIWHVTSTSNPIVVSALHFFDRFLQFWPMRYFSIRMLSIAEKE